MLPDYIIYDEMKKERERREREGDRPQLEVPRHIPYWPEFDAPDHDKDKSPCDRGVTIIQT